ncbi:MAG: two-component regulator propeller domain-containing protein [Panacibacter sp.]
MKKLPQTLLLCLLPVFLYTQEQIVTTDIPGEWLTSKEGLSQGMINSILQDREGYMWFATKDGLNKYDGYKITVYRHNPDDNYSLPDNYVTSIFEDDNNNFWVSTLSRGMYLFEKNTERFFPVQLSTEKEIPGNNATVGLWFHHDQMLIQNTSDLLIYNISLLHPGNYADKLSGKIKRVFSYNQLQKDGAYKFPSALHKNQAVSWQQDGSVWIKYPDTLLCATPGSNKNKWVLNGCTSSVFGLPREEFKYVTFDMSPLQSEKLYYLYKNKLCRIDLKTFKTEELVTVTDHPLPVCLKMETLSNGMIYFFLENPFLYNPVSGELKKIMIERGKEVFTAMYTSLCNDNTGSAWYGTAGFGIFKSDMLKPSFRVYRSNDNTAAFRLLYGKEWQQNEQQIRQHIFIDFQNFIRDKQGNFWFTNYLEDKGLQAKLVCFDPAKNTFKKFDFLHGDNYRTTYFFVDMADSLWIFSDEGLNKKMLYRFNKKSGLADIAAQFPVQQTENNQYPFVSACWQDAKNIFWFATVQGLFRYNPSVNEWKYWKNIPGNTTSLPSDMLFTICADPKEPSKYLWAGTNGAGFCRFEMATGKCIRFTDKNGLPNNVVYGILSDSSGNLWLSTNRGLSCFNPANKMFRSFTKQDNLPGDEFNRNQYARLPNGELMFGGVDGYIAFNPADVLQTKPQVPIVFTGLSISNKPVDWKQDSTVISAPVGYAKKIILHPGQNMFTVSFASLDYRSNEKKFYKYRLDGFDHDWTNPTNKNEATYTNLSPGTYLFHVTGTNTDGVWNAKSISIEIMVLPYWYQSAWFKILIVLIVAGGLYTLYRYRLHQHLKLLTIRNRIAGDLHDEIGGTLSSISLSSTIIQNKLTNENEDVQNLLQQISSHTDNMMEAMSDIVWAINTRNDNFESMINRMRAFAVEMLEPHGVEIHFSVSDAVLHQSLDMVQRKNTYLLFKEAINNAAKYAHCNNVWVTIEMQGKKIFLQIKDDGKGFAYTKGVKTHSENSFGGNGLPGMYKRATELKGALNIDTTPGKGTTIQLEFAV